MTTTKTTRYDSRTVARIVSELQAMLDSSVHSQEILSEESRGYATDDERIDSLQTRIDQLQEAINALEGIE